MNRIGSRQISQESLVLRPDEWDDPRRWRTRDQLHQAILLWTEHTDDRRRRRRALGKLTPAEYELPCTTPAAVAAGSVPSAVNRSRSSPG